MKSRKSNYGSTFIQFLMILTIVSVLVEITNYIAASDKATDNKFADLIEESEDSIEEQLAAGTDPTKLFEATAAGGNISNSLSCDDVMFGNAKGNTYIKEYSGNIYVSNINGFKAFKLDSSTYYANQVEMDSNTQRLVRAYKKCKKPALLSSYNIAFRTIP